MIVYFDTSALIPLLINEAASDPAARLWDEAERVVSVRLIYAEAHAALAMARRVRRLDEAGLRRAVRDLSRVYEQLDRVQIDDDMVRRAGALAEEHSLRGYDAVHLAAAERLAGPEIVLAAGDHDLCRAAGRLGIHVAELI